MKSLLFIALSLMLVSGVSAQDLIVTTANDSIHCHITGEDENNVYLTLRAGNDRQIRDTYLPKERIGSVQKDFCSDQMANLRYRDDYARYQIAVDFGYSGRINEWTALKGAQVRGIGYTVSGFYFPCKNIGVGALFRNSFFNGVRTTGYGDSSPAVRMRTDAKTYYVGPAIVARAYMSKRRSALLFTLSGGCYSMDDRRTEWVEGDEIAYKLSVNAFSGYCSLGYDFSLTRRSALGVAFTMVFTQHKVLTQTRYPDHQDRLGERFNECYVTIGYRFGN